MKKRLYKGMNNITTQRWLSIFLSILLGLFLIGFVTILVLDPYFHFHKPLTRYHLADERNQNYGILRFFDYNAIVIGTSMTENFKTSQVDQLFKVKSVKVPFAGASYKEIKDVLDYSYEYNDGIKLVIRGLDYYSLIEDSDYMNSQADSFPTYLYDKNLLNDINYVFNKQAFLWSGLNSILTITSSASTTFDEYANWNDIQSERLSSFDDNYNLGIYQTALSSEDMEIIKNNVEKNLVSIAKKHPETQFIYFYTPYSISYWDELYAQGDLQRQLAAERIATDMMLNVDNIFLYSFNTEFDIITNPQNYRDILHYSGEINDYMTEVMADSSNRLIKSNVDSYREKEQSFFVKRYGLSN